MQIRFRTMLVAVILGGAAAAGPAHTDWQTTLTSAHQAFAEADHATAVRTRIAGLRNSG